MAEEVSRCGRRKQKNPKRKNHEDDPVELLVMLATAMPVSTYNPKLWQVLEKMTEFSPVDLENALDEKESALEKQIKKPAEERKKVTEDKENEEVNSKVHEEDTEIDHEDEKHNTVTVGEGPKSPHTSEMIPNGCHGSKHSGLQDYLHRSDTAVIYPESVSDQEDDDKSEKDKSIRSEEDMEDKDEGCLTSPLDSEYCLNCPYCEKGFTRLYILRDHIKLHHSDKINKFSQYTCPKCNAGFVLKSQLDKHLAFHSPTSQVCKICHKIFANVYRLQRHMISHDESTDLRKFKCPECGKAFKFKHHLKEHIRIHSGEKPFQCGNCGKRFSHSGSYSSHMTSKKCWVMNVGRMKADNKPEGPTDGSPVRPAERPELNKYMDPTSAVKFHSMFRDFPPHFPSPDHQRPPLAHNPIGHMNSIGPHMLPFLQYIPPGHLINPMMPGMPPVTSAFTPFSSLPNPSAVSPRGRVEEVKSPMPSPSKAESSEKGDQMKSTPDIESSPIEKARSSSEVSDGEDEHNEDGKCDNQRHETAEERIRRILEAVNATITKQQTTTEEKTHISKLTSGSIEEEEKTLKTHASVPETLAMRAKEALQQHLQKVFEEQNEHGNQDTDNEKCEPDENCNVKGDCRCHFCKESFRNPIEQHQHERYLCKLNTEILKPVLSDGELETTSNGTSTGPSTPVSRVETDEDESDTSSLMDKEDSTIDSRRYRVRSMISEEQLAVLRRYYEINPRPRKFELIKIGAEIGFPKRVVQVWFQNMRARDRKLGKNVPYFPTMARFKKREGSTSPMPRVPRSVSPTTSVTASAPYIPVVPQFTNPTQPRMLNYMFHNHPPVKVNGHYVIPPMHNLPTSSFRQTEQLMPLDLSNKQGSPPKEIKEADQKKEHGSVLNLSHKENKKDDVRFEDSAIFKYMQLQREGMLGSGAPSPGSMLTSSQNIFIGPNAHVYTHDQIKRDFIQKLELLDIHRNRGGMSPSSIKETMALQKRPADLNSSYGSNKSDSHDSGVDEGHDRRTQRQRRKSWKQVEAEETDYQFDSQLTIDEDGMSPRKKRRSWKHHKVDIDEGMYACDMCDKMFSKQSSLARHKYEHSGARPFICDICSKAFKHKHHLTEHKRLHSGEKPFQCKKCGKRFSHSGSYSQHMNHRYKYCKPGKDGDDSSEEMSQDGDIGRDGRVDQGSPVGISQPVLGISQSAPVGMVN